MFYYLLKGNEVFVHKSSLKYYDVKVIYGKAVCGCFGRLDYAEAWKDYYNKTITLKELNLRLEN